MLKDRAQKATALALSVSKRWLPQLEVEIEASTRIERSKFLLTDIDVLAVAPAPIGGHVRMVFDCKSGAKESAIGRAFWLHGVMTRAAAAQGFVVLNEKVAIKHDHRISASELSVSLLHESEFEDLAQCMGGTTKNVEAAVANIDAWDQFLSVGAKYPSTSEYLSFAKSSFWMIKDPGEQCRKTVAKLRAIRTEMDPAKIEHIALFGDSLCLFLLALSELANRLFLVLLRPTSQEEFSSSLLALLYGGYENLEAAQKIRRLTSGAGSDDAVSIFPEIGKFEQLVREILQAPQQALRASLLARELSFSFLVSAGTTELQSQLAVESPYAAKFVLMACEYLQKAAKLPSEFAITYSDAALSLSASVLKSVPHRVVPYGS
ncbi:hypothetical protein [Burkholderia cepacia]|uniref:hypothetical protein n=1 Tax=Burkholderia cepacia TaxID=292 RepID=UPI002AB655BE|nr:hypothetical protein [Burkholderia cepacia]